MNPSPPALAAYLQGINTIPQIGDIGLLYIALPETTVFVRFTYTDGFFPNQGEVMEIQFYQSQYRPWEWSHNFRLADPLLVLSLVAQLMHHVIQLENIMEPITQN